MATHVGWRNFWWLNVALLGLSFLMVLFMFPETKWHRIHPDDEKDINPPGNNQDAHENRKTSSLQHVDKLNSPLAEQNLEHIATAERDPWLGRGAPNKQQWKLFQSNAHPFKSILLDLWLPWKLFAFPIAEFASFVVSWSCSSFLTLNLTQTQAFAAPPYSWSSQSIGKCVFVGFAVTCTDSVKQASPTSQFSSERSLASQPQDRSATGSLRAQLNVMAASVSPKCVCQP